jgi:short-subunit dehydrogenase
MKFETALVTGGTTGIGEALVRQLVAEGCRVVFCARNQDKIDALSNELGENAIGIQADVSDVARAEALVHEAEELLGGIDLLIANAGRGRNVVGPKMKVEHITGVLQLNVMGGCATIAAGIEGMMKRQKGHLVGISSIAANRGLPTSASYCASKACFSTFMESLRVDLRQTPLHVTDIRPGFIDTPLTKKNRFKMPFLMTSDRAARLILSAIRKKKGVYSFPWQMAFVGWFLRWVPSWLFESVAGRNTRA